MRYYSVIILLFLLSACVAQGPSGEVISKAPLDVYDEEKVLQDITPAFSDSTDLEKQVIAVPEDVADLPKKIVKEGELVTFPNLRATDPDGDPIAYTFTPPLDEYGMWQTKVGDAGAYRIVITASDSKSKIEQQMLLIVEGKNKPPVLEDFLPITVREGENITISAVVSDPDNDNLTLRYTGWLSTSKYQTTPSDAGIHIVTVIANDGIHEVKKDVKIIVENEDRPPVLDQLDPVTINEGDKLVVEPSAIDPDGDEILITCTLPLTPVCTWQTKKGDAGTYRITMTASDKLLEDTKELVVIVQSTNQPPIISGPDKLVVVEGDTVVLDMFIISDPDGDEVLVSYNGWMKEMKRETSYQDAGVHKVFIHATDSEDTVTQELEITIKNRNRAPVFTAGAFD